MQSAKEMPEEILWWRPIAWLRYRVQDQDEEKLETVRHEDLLGIFVNDVVVRNSPACGIVLERLARVSPWRSDWYTLKTDCVEKRAQHGQHYLLVWARREVGDSLDAFDWENVYSLSDRYWDVS